MQNSDFFLSYANLYTKKALWIDKKVAKLHFYCGKFCYFKNNSDIAAPNH